MKPLMFVLPLMLCQALAQPNAEFEKLIPSDKQLDPDWVQSLTARGEPTLYRGKELELIGMPVGGICAGQLYLGGDGKLWMWDIFNQRPAHHDVFKGPEYANPPRPFSPLEQGFALRVRSGGKTQHRKLDGHGFSDISFRGEYPIGSVFYSDKACPVEVKLEAFSPFIPLNSEDSALPATILEFTLKNRSSATVEAELAGWLENAVCKFSPGVLGVRHNRVVRDAAMVRVDASVQAADTRATVFEDFEKPTYEGWEVQGTAFGSGPVTPSQVPAYQGNLGMQGQRAANSHASAPGSDPVAKDNATGKLISRQFTIEHDFIDFLLGGGNDAGNQGLRLLVDEKVVREATGTNANTMTQLSWDVRDLKGKQARFEIVDSETTGRGNPNIGVDSIRFRNAGRPEIVFEDFEAGDYRGWKTEGDAFGVRPSRADEMPDYMSAAVAGLQGKAMASSGASAPGSDPAAKDRARGKLSSPEFKIERDYIRFRIGGGANDLRLLLRLLIDGKAVRVTTSHLNNTNDHRLRVAMFDVREFIGRTARLEIVDDTESAWGNPAPAGFGYIGVDDIVFTDENLAPLMADQCQDSGTMSLALLGEASRAVANAANPEALFEAAAGDSASAPIPGRLLGAVGRSWKIPPGQERKAAFVIAWHFPNERMNPAPAGRFYATKFGSAGAVADYIGRNFERLAGTTRLWRDTWYDSSLPYWFLDRTFANTSTLATDTCHLLTNRRFYTEEGSGGCGWTGSCTHVWMYAQAVARLFPDLERSSREMQDFADGIGFDPSTGGIWVRGERRGDFVLDGQAGNVLRAYREHQMSHDLAFLQRNWAKTKKALQWLITQDANNDGMIEGWQSTTLDGGSWWGAMSWTSSLYLAALRAGEQMATLMEDREFAAQARSIADAGARNLIERLYNGEYFIHKPDNSRPNSFIIGNGCHIDQVYGQSWADQLGLGRVLPQEPTRSALRAIWKYNFTKDVGPYRARFKEGRWYAMPGEPGTIMTTWPKGDREYPDLVDTNAMSIGVGYLNECMSGFEHQVASHMIGEGMLTEGLAVVRAVHERYAAGRRNPWNEIECGQHYARAMASYGVFTEACGYQYNGPLGRLGFDPKIGPQKFKAAFTAAEGWGSYRQTLDGSTLRAQLELKYGKLVLRTLALGSARAGAQVSATRNGQPVAATLERNELRFEPQITLEAGQKLEITLQQ